MVAVSELTDPGIVHVRVYLYAWCARAKTGRRDREVAEGHALASIVLRRDWREEVQNELDIASRHRECCVCGSEVGGGKRGGLDKIPGTRNAEEAVGVAVDSCYD